MASEDTLPPRSPAPFSSDSLPCSLCVSLSPLQACERDSQCGFGLCCAVSLWLRGLRMCVPRGVEGDECHPFSHKVCDCGVGAEASRPRPRAHSLRVSPTLVFRVTGSWGGDDLAWQQKSWQTGWALEKLLITAAAIDLPHLGLSDQSHSSLWSCGNGSGYFCQRHIHLWIQTPKEQRFFLVFF